VQGGEGTPEAKVRARPVNGGLGVLGEDTGLLTTVERRGERGPRVLRRAERGNGMLIGKGTGGG
jgi:hypothetical protein